MQIDTFGKNVIVSTLLREQVERQLGFALDRLSHHVRAVKVRLEDLNGPRGGVDKRCAILVEGDKGGALVASATGENFPLAIAWAAQKTALALARTVERRREKTGAQRRVRRGGGWTRAGHLARNRPAERERP